MDRQYITAVEFSDFNTNQRKLISVLNHNVTKLAVDVNWLKKLVGWQVGLIATIGAGVILSILKTGGI